MSDSKSDDAFEVALVTMFILRSNILGSLVLLLMLLMWLLNG